MDVIWYNHNRPTCGDVRTGFYANPYVGATFTCGICGSDLYIKNVDNDLRTMNCEDMNERLAMAYGKYVNC